MLQAYNKGENIKILSGEAIPFQSVSIRKGITATLTDVKTISLNRAGVYMVSFDAIVNSTDTPSIVAQLYVDNVPQPQAITSATSDADIDKEAIGFTTLVQVNHNNSCSCCDKGVKLQIINTGAVTIYDHANIVVTKIC